MAVTLLCSRCHYPFKTDGFQMMCGDCQIAQREQSLGDESARLRGVISEQAGQLDKYRRKVSFLNSTVGERDDLIRRLNKELEERQRK